MTKITFTVNKLIRDKIPQLMQDEGVIATTKNLHDGEYIAALKAKIQEEAQEIAGTKNREQLVEELADLFEVTKCLIDASGITQDEIDICAQRKNDRKGSFKARVFNISVEMDDINPAKKYYDQAQPD